ncbi:MAG: hypothetical protein R6U78_01530 [Bacteroidales bacterium]
MKKVSRIIAIVLLFLLGVSALFGALGLILDPSGRAMQLPEGILDPTPFHNYLIPGILLGIFNGLFSLIIAILVIMRIRLYPWLIIFQGCVLMVWLTAEVLMGMYYPALTLPYYILGVLLILCGLFVRRTDNIRRARTEGS